MYRPLTNRDCASKTTKQCVVERSVKNSTRTLLRNVWNHTPMSTQANSFATYLRYKQCHVHGSWQLWRKIEILCGIAIFSRTIANYQSSVQFQPKTNPKAFTFVGDFLALGIFRGWKKSWFAFRRIRKLCALPSKCQKTTTLPRAALHWSSDLHIGFDVIEHRIEELRPDKVLSSADRAFTLVTRQYSCVRPQPPVQCPSSTRGK